MNIVIIGTSRGIGLELVRTFLSGGHKIAAGIRGPRVSPALESLQGAYRRDKLFVFPANITNENEIRRGANLVKDFLGKADVLINAAGVLLPGDLTNPLQVCDISELRETFEVNTIGPIMVVKYFSPLIDPGGKVFIMTSERVGVTHTGTGTPCYALSKSAATKAVGILNASFNDLDFYAVYPGPVHAAMTDREKPVAKIDPAEVAEGFYKMVSGAIPLSRDTWYITYTGEALEA